MQRLKITTVGQNKDIFGIVSPRFPEALFINEDIANYELSKANFDSFKANVKHSPASGNSLVSSIVIHSMMEPFHSRSRAWNDFVLVNNKNVKPGTTQVLHSLAEKEKVLPFGNPMTKRTSLDKLATPLFSGGVVEEKHLKQDFHFWPEPDETDFFSSPYHLREMAIDGWVDNDRDPPFKGYGAYFEFVREVNVADYDTIDPGVSLSIPGIDYTSSDEKIIERKKLDNEITDFMKRGQDLVASKSRSLKIRDDIKKKKKEDTIDKDLETLHDEMMKFISKSRRSPLFRKMLDVTNYPVFENALFSTIVGILDQSRDEKKAFDYFVDEMKKIVDDNNKRVNIMGKEIHPDYKDINTHGDEGLYLRAMNAGMKFQKHVIDEWDTFNFMKENMKAARDKQQWGLASNLENDYHAQVGRMAQLAGFKFP